MSEICCSIIRNTIREEGFLGSFRGVPATLFGKTGQRIIKFVFSDEIKKMITNGNPQDATAWQCGQAGFTAGVLEGAFTAGPEFVRKNQAVQPTKPSFRQVITNVYQQQGARYFFHGVAINPVTKSLYSGSFFFAADIAKKSLPKAENPIVESGKNFVAGVGASFFGTLISNPCDVAHTRQVNSVYEAKNLNCFGLFSQINSIVRENGITGLYKGGLEKCIKVAPGMGIMLAITEYLNKEWRKINEHNATVSENNTPSLK